MWSLECFCSVVGVPKGPRRLAPGFNLGMHGPTVLSERAQERRQSMRDRGRREQEQDRKPRRRLNDFAQSSLALPSRAEMENEGE